MEKDFFSSIEYDEMFKNSLLPIVRIITELKRKEDEENILLFVIILTIAASYINRLGFAQALPPSFFQFLIEVHLSIIYPTKVGCLIYQGLVKQ